MAHPFVLLSCLALATSAPQDAVPERRGLIHRSEGAFDGLTLFVPLRSGVARLVDLDGEVVHTWPSERAGYVTMLENGNLLLLGSPPDKHPRFHGPGVSGGLLQEMDWEGNVVWSHLAWDDSIQLHHDVDVLPNGNLLYVMREYRSREEAIANGRDPERVDEEGLWPDVLVEIRPWPDGDGGEVVWEWRAWDHLVQDQDATKANHGSVAAHPGRIDLNADHRDRPPLSEEELAERRELERQMAALGYGGDDGEEDGSAPSLGTAPDWLHVNAVTLHPELDLLVLSVPNLNELWVLDHSTTTQEAASGSGGRWGRGGELLWRWGNPRTFRAGGEGDQQLFFQHDPTWVPGETPGELRLLVFNNGGDEDERGYSSIDELVLPFDARTGFRHEPGMPFGPERPAWTWRLPEDCTSSFISGVRRLPNGNLLVCAGVPGRILEVTRAGELVWDYENPFGNEGESERQGSPPPHALYRATRIPSDHPGLADRPR